MLVVRDAQFIAKVYILGQFFCDVVIIKATFSNECLHIYHFITNNADVEVLTFCYPSEFATPNDLVV